MYRNLPKFSIGACWMGLRGFCVTKTGPVIGGRSAEKKIKLKIQLNYFKIHFIN